jgi:hypothetical protein
MVGCPVDWPEIAVNGRVVPEVVPEFVPEAVPEFCPSWLNPELPPELLLACSDPSPEFAAAVEVALTLAVAPVVVGDAKLPFKLLTD